MFVKHPSICVWNVILNKTATRHYISDTFTNLLLKNTQEIMHLEYIYVVLIVYHILHQIHVVDVTVTGTRTMINLLVSEVVDDPIVSVNCYCNR